MTKQNPKREIDITNLASGEERLTWIRGTHKHCICGGEVELIKALPFKTHRGVARIGICPSCERILIEKEYELTTLFLNCKKYPIRWLKF